MIRSLRVWRIFVNPLTAVLGVLNSVIYVCIYMPLKTRTSMSTRVGAVCGGLPPVMGWAGEVGEGAGLLFALQFFWQMPHFLSLAYVYRDE